MQGDLALQRVGREDGGLVSDNEKMRKAKRRQISSVSLGQREL